MCDYCIRHSCHEQQELIIDLFVSRPAPSWFQRFSVVQCFSCLFALAFGAFVSYWLLY